MNKAILFIAVAILSQVSVRAQVVTHLSGKVEGRQGGTVLIASESQNMRYEAIHIPIHEGRFSYTITTTDVEIFSAAFIEDVNRGAFRPAMFCAQGDTVHLTMFGSTDFEVHGGDENRKIMEYYDFMKRLTDGNRAQYKAREEELRKEDKLMTEKGARLFALRNQESESIDRDSLGKVYNQAIADGSFFTPQYKALMSQRDSIGRVVNLRFDQYNSENPSLFVLSVTLKKLMQSEGDQAQLEKMRDQVVDNYTSHWAEHPYYKRCIKYVDAKVILFSKGRYVDFTAPDLDGRMHKLSDLIGGKVAILDLWASWCAPCRRNSMSMIPLYEKYAGTDFTIVGVAGEFKNDKEMRNAISKDGYKWTNLVELDRRAGIWDLYGAGNVAGKILLIDRDGRIIAQDPSVEDVEKILLEKNINKTNK